MTYVASSKNWWSRGGSFKKLAVPAIVVAAVAGAMPAQATLIPGGTLSVAVLAPPVVNLAPPAGQYNPAAGATFEIAGSGSLMGASGVFFPAPPPWSLGTMNGVVAFSKVAGTTLAASLPDFFTFYDGAGGNYKFSATSVQTLSYSVAPGSTAIGLYLVGTTLDTNLGYSPTWTSLTLTFNSTNHSPFSASATLAVPPSVPEPASWALMLGGFGLMGVMLRGRKTRAEVSFG